MLQVGIFIPGPPHGVYVVDLMYEMHPFLPPSPCEELGPVPPGLCIYMSKTTIWVRETNALFWGAGKLQYNTGGLLRRRKFVGSHSEYHTLPLPARPEPQGNSNFLPYLIKGFSIPKCFPREPKE